MNNLLYTALPPLKIKKNLYFFTVIYQNILTLQSTPIFSSVIYEKFILYLSSYKGKFLILNKLNILIKKKNILVSQRIDKLN